MNDFELEFIKSSFQGFRKEGNYFFDYIDGSDEKINLFVEHFNTSCFQRLYALFSLKTTINIKSKDHTGNI